ncbi:hypothetical protein [Nonomuraea antri]|uniref:hypothetical protein n=1 Tax=Nonomuraea antri TaxID=2730852 RepID=UPI001C2B939D|nr:hypothetical protein [Nonomuraea antri]
MTDGTKEYNDRNCRVSYDHAKSAVIRLGHAQAQDLRPHRCAAVTLTPGWIRSEMMLEHFGMGEENWRDALAREPHRPRARPLDRGDAGSGGLPCSCRDRCGSRPPGS